MNAKSYQIDSLEKRSMKPQEVNQNFTKPNKITNAQIRSPQNPDRNNTENNDIYNELANWELKTKFKKKFIDFSEKRREKYPNFEKSSLEQQKEILLEMNAHLNEEYFFKLYIGKFQKHSSLKTKEFCYQWFINEKNTHIKEEALNKFEERISVEEAFTYIFEKFDPTSQNEYRHFYECSCDEKEQILGEMLKIKIEKESITKNLCKAYQVKTNEALSKKWINQDEYNLLQQKWQKSSITEEQTKALKELENYLSRCQNLLEQFNSIDIKIRFKYHSKFYKSDNEGKKTLLEKLAASIIEQTKTQKEDQNKRAKQKQKSKIYFNLAQILEKQNNGEKALEAMKMALQFASKLNSATEEIKDKIKQMELKLKVKKTEETQAKTTVKIMEILDNLENKDRKIRKYKDELKLENDLMAIVTKSESSNQGQLKPEEKNTHLKKNMGQVKQAKIYEENQNKGVIKTQRQFENITRIKITEQGADLDQIGKEKLSDKIAKLQANENIVFHNKSIELSDGNHSINALTAKKQIHRKTQAMGILFLQKTMQFLGLDQNQLSVEQKKLITTRKQAIEKHLSA